MSEKKKIISVIGEYSDRFIYDPHGLCGVKTPKNQQLEKQIFGVFADIVNEQNESSCPD